MKKVAPTIDKAALLSDCGTYRYRLTRTYDVSLKRVLWLMVNPSTADATMDDPTLRRCIGFSRSWGYGGNVELVNLFALRSPNPAALKEHGDPVGPDNDLHIVRAALDPANTIVVCAWGAAGRYMGRDAKIIDMLRPFVHLHALEMPHPIGEGTTWDFTETGEPKHPLYLKKISRPFVMWPRSAEQKWQHYLPVHVTQAHIAAGVRGGGQLFDSPVELALFEATGDIWTVDPTSIMDFNETRCMRAAPLVQGFVQDFDAGKPVEPFAFYFPIEWFKIERLQQPQQETIQ